MARDIPTPGIPRMRDLGELIDRVLDIAADELDRQTLDVDAYDDGDYRIRVFETLPITNGNVEERVEIRYDRKTETIQHRHYEYHKRNGEFLRDDVRDLESYPDPLPETRDRDDTPTDNSAGGSGSKYHREEGDPIRLMKESSGWRIGFGMEARAAGIEAGDYLYSDLEDAETDPLLILNRADDPGENPDSNPELRRVMDTGTSLSVKIPRRHLDEFGLGLNLDDYDNENPLLFEPLVDDGLVGLVPLGYVDGREFVPRAFRDQDSGETTPEESESEQATLGGSVESTATPISEQAITAAAQTVGVNRDRLVDVLETINESVSEDDLNLIDEASPVQLDDVTVYFVTPETWPDAADDLALDEDLLEAAKLAYVRASEEIILKTGVEESQQWVQKYDVLLLTS
ncbi:MULTISPECIES: hypothetical protein [Halorussus]|uniref:hypothetical protein n=1 Tax=Halorussus TaxID=1070314 RepID=UPI00209F8761|nr:hypothetical protein [Halorussus vallis]USZ78736.1 hypothetical protein NGM07_24810 [Halorussus vallis]